MKAFLQFIYLSAAVLNVASLLFLPDPEPGDF